MAEETLPTQTILFLDFGHTQKKIYERMNNNARFAQAKGNKNGVLAVDKSLSLALSPNECLFDSMRPHRLSSSGCHTEFYAPEVDWIGFLHLTNGSTYDMNMRMKIVFGETAAAETKPNNRDARKVKNEQKRKNGSECA